MTSRQPARPVRRPSSRPTTSEPQPGKAIRLMVVDDHHLVREMLAGVLDAQPDVDVVAAVGSAEEALRMLAIVKPTVILLDVSLPGLSGIEALEILRHHRHIAVVVFTSDDGRRTAEAAKQGGALHVVSKGSNIDVLVGAIRAAWVQRPFIEPAQDRQPSEPAPVGFMAWEGTPGLRQADRDAVGEAKLLEALEADAHTTNEHVWNKVRGVPPYDQLGPEAAAEVRQFTRWVFERFVACLRQRRRLDDAELQRFETAGAGRARAGIPVDRLLVAFNEAFDCCHERLVQLASSERDADMVPVLGALTRDLRYLASDASAALRRGHEQASRDALAAQRRDRVAGDLDPYDLTDQERRVLGCVAEGHTNATIAGMLSVEECTVKTHVSHILQKLGVDRRTEAIAVAYTQGLLGDEYP